MPPIRKRKGRTFAFTVPYHKFLGPGTDLENLKYHLPLNKLDRAAKAHDINYSKRWISTKAADEQFYEDSKDTGIIGAASRAAVRLKHLVGLDEAFRGLSNGDSTIVNSAIHSNMDNQSDATVEDSGPGNGWDGHSIGGTLPNESTNEVRSYVIKRTFTHMVRTCDMNSTNGHFTKYEGSETAGVHNVGHFAWAQPESGDYFLSTWVTIPKWEATMRNASSYRVKSQGFKIHDIICGEWLTKNNEEVFVPNPQPYFQICIDNGQYIGYGNLEGITKVPNKNFHEIQPNTGPDAELPKYKYNYAAPIHLLNKLPNSGDITADNKATDIKMISLHDWREMPNIQKLHQGDTFTHIWHNHSLLRKPLTNVMTQGNYVILGSMMTEPGLMTSSISGGMATAWDSGLDVSTAPKYGTTTADAETNLEWKKARKRMRTETQEDLVQTEIATIAFDHQRARTTNSTEPGKIQNLELPGHEQTSGCFTVSNRTVINKVLYTNEEAPEMVLINVPPILRPNATGGILYFTFEMTYMLEIECYYEAFHHPQKVPMTDHTCALAATSANFDFEKQTIVPPNRHLHGQSAKGMMHNHSTHVWENSGQLQGLSYGKFINK